jgi:hypothetical protein
MKTKTKLFAVAAFSSLIAGGILSMPVEAKKDWSTSPLPPEMYRQVERAARQTKSGKYQQATQTINEVLVGATDVPKCLAIAASTEAAGSPMLEARRACLNRALQLCSNNDDLILVALKARQYQMFEITRQSITSMMGNCKTVRDLYELARRCQEVALNDVAHMAMEKAYTGVKDQQGAFLFAETCKGLGMEDLLRKVVKDMIDDDSAVPDLCDILLKCEPYNLRDQTRYGLRKALDHAASVPDMEAIYETARRLNEPDVANRALYFVRRGKVIEKIKSDRVNYEAQLKSWREGIDIDAARQQLGAPASTDGAPRRANDPPTSGF